MTRDAGQVTPRQALAGALLAAVVIAVIVTGLSLLLDAGQPEPPLPAPAEPAPATACPEQVVARSAVHVTASELIECPRSFDGQRVRYEGEVVGEPRAAEHRSRQTPLGRLQKGALGRRSRHPAQTARRSPARSSKSSSAAAASPCWWTHRPAWSCSSRRSR